MQYMFVTAAVKPCTPLSSSKIFRTQCLVMYLTPSPQPCAMRYWLLLDPTLHPELLPNRDPIACFECVPQVTCRKAVAFAHPFVLCRQ